MFLCRRDSNSGTKRDTQRRHVRHAVGHVRVEKGVLIKARLVLKTVQFLTIVGAVSIL